MRKAFLLPLAAVLCFGCSKSEWVEAPSPMAVGQAPDVQTVVLAISNMIGHDVLGCDTYVDYTDGSGQRQTESLNGLSSPEIEILQGTDVAFRVHVWDPQGGKIYCAVRHENCDEGCPLHPEGKAPWFDDLSAVGQVQRTLVIRNIAESGQYSVWAALEDFSDGVLGR